MTKSIFRTLAAIVVLLGFASANAETQRLQGSDSGRPPAFTVTGPWLMDWSTKSEFPLLASIEMRLYDGESGEYIGMIAELKGTGSGLKLFEKAGTYQLVVVGTSVDWDVEISAVDDAQAAILKRGADGEKSLLDASTGISRLVPESSFESWRPEGNETLLLFDDAGLAWRIGFSPACPGLESATAVSFVMRADDSATGQYDSILLEDGQRCHFRSVTPGLMN